MSAKMRRAVAHERQLLGHADDVALPRVSLAEQQSTRSCPSTTMLPRQFASRNTMCGTPSRTWTTTFAPNRMRAVGRANFAKVTPVTSATPSVPTSASTTTTTWP